MNYKVVKLGGSVISPQNAILDQKLVCSYVSTIRNFFSKENDEGVRLVLVVGGGNASRVYREFSLECGEDSDVDQHRIGITATWLNSELFRSLLDDICHKRVLGVGVYAENRKEGETRIENDFQEWLSGNKPVLISGGYINGASTDFNAILLASKIGVEEIYKLTSVDYVYTSDPAKDEDSKPIKDISWVEYLRMFGESLEKVVHKPGGHVPIDVLGAKLAHENKISCYLGSGDNPEALRAVLKGKGLEGTLIHP